MNTRQELLATIDQLPDEKLPSLLNHAQALRDAEGLSSCEPINVRAFLKLPAEQQQVLLKQQAVLLAPYFQPGTEEMEWAEDYIEDDNWDGES
jgi:hypothetical protein